MVRSVNDCKMPGNSWWLQLLKRQILTFLSALLGCWIHNPKVGGSIPPPATNQLENLGVSQTFQVTHACPDFAGHGLNSAPARLQGLAARLEGYGNPKQMAYCSTV